MYVSATDWEKLGQVTYLCVHLFILFIYLFGVLRHFQHCTGHIMTGSWKGRGNQYIQFVRVLYCKLLTNSKQLPAFPLEAMQGIEPQPQRWEARVLPLCHRGPYLCVYMSSTEAVLAFLLFMYMKSSCFVSVFSSFFIYLGMSREH